MFKRLAATTILSLALIFATAASAEAGAVRFTLFGGFRAGAYCDGSGIVSGLPVPNAGFAVINAPSSGLVMATVSIHGSPNTYHQFRLIQGAADCDTVDGAVVTNDDGVATVHLQEEAVSSTAFVHVDQFETGPSGIPFLVNFSYVTETYRH